MEIKILKFNKYKSDTLSNKNYSLFSAKVNCVISNYKDIANKVASKKEVDAAAIESIASFMFDQVYEEMFKFNDLILNLPGFCSFFYTKKRLEQLKLRLTNKLNGDFTTLNNQKVKMSFLTKLSNDETEALLKKIDVLLERYDEYISEKRTQKQKQIEYETTIAQSKGVI